MAGNVGSDLAETEESELAEHEESAKRRQIMEGAREVFLSQGFDAASMGEIARAAGVSKGTLYVYFDSKEKLFEALTVEEKKGLAEVLFSLDGDDPDVRAVLTRLGHTFLAHLCNREHVSSVRMVIGASEKFPRFGQMFFDEWRNGSIEDDRKPWVFDVPTHDPQCVGIELFL